MQETSSCSCLTVVPGPAWLLLNKICIPLFRAGPVFVPHLVQEYECLPDHGVPSSFCLHLLNFFGDCPVREQNIDGEESAVVPVLFENIFDHIISLIDFLGAVFDTRVSFTYLSDCAVIVECDEEATLTRVLIVD